MRTNSIQHICMYFSFHCEFISLCVYVCVYNILLFHLVSLECLYFSLAWRLLHSLQSLNLIPGCAALWWLWTALLCTDTRGVRPWHPREIAERLSSPGGRFDRGARPGGSGPEELHVVPEDCVSIVLHGLVMVPERPGDAPALRLRAHDPAPQLLHTD
jgi:hypothetical protein